MRQKVSYTIAAVLFAAVCLGVVAQAQQPAQPPFATTKVDGTNNVYIFRNGGHQSMFVVTSAGVIATDPIGYGRRRASDHRISPPTSRRSAPGSRWC